MASPTVHILLATYNGERYLPQQWASLQTQEDADLVLHLADDGSTDGTVALLRELDARRAGAIREVHWLDAPPRRSATRSFLALLADAVQRCPEAQWFAYCDQDDVWLPRKLARALEVLKPYAGSRRPALYGGRTLAIDEGGRDGGLSPLFRQPPSFRNAVAQNIMGGNTMVMNRAAALLVAQAARLDVVSHDWLTYQLVSGADGFVHYDARPFVRYRQHDENLVGSNLGWKARFRRLRRMLRGDYSQWNQLNVAALLQRTGALSEGNRAVLQAFAQARQSATPWARMAWLRRSGAFRQKPSQQLMLWLACVLGRI